MAFEMEAAEQTRRLQQEQKMNLSPKQSVMSSNASFRHTPTQQRVVLKSIATALHAGLKADIGQGIFVLGFQICFFGNGTANTGALDGGARKPVDDDAAVEAT
jgi:hypothetical protein